MKPVTTLILCAAAVFLVFLQAYENGLPSIAGVRIDLLPSLVTYAALSLGPASATLVAITGGAAFDSLSANPIGISIGSLGLVAFATSFFQEMILRDKPTAHAVLGATAGVVAPALALVMLMAKGLEPRTGWVTLWQWLWLGTCNALAAPLWFNLFGRIERALTYEALPPTTFRTDREIKRGRH